jgi:protein SCO1/2
MALAVIAALAVMLWPRRPMREPPPVIGVVPDFELTDHEGTPFKSAVTLKGHPWVANFIFTRCTTVCPIFTSKMARLEEQTRARGDRLRLVSFSVDPEFDTPEVLKRYALDRGADLSSRWWFLTGATEEITRIVEKSLKIAMEKIPGAPVGDSIRHGTHFVLVDGGMRIRGYYDLSDADVLERLERDLELLE